MRILVLAPHTDDAEFGCGGTIARFIANGHDVHSVAFSVAKGVKPDTARETVRQELIEASAVLGIRRKNLRLLDFEVRTFPQHRQEILDAMISLQLELDPEYVFMPSTCDTHQDHQVVSAEGFRAFKRTTILGYELPWNNLTFTTGAFIPLSEEHLSRKLLALRKYKSQKGRPFARAPFIRNLANVRGTQIGVKYAEAFESIRWVMR